MWTYLFGGRYGHHSLYPRPRGGADVGSQVRAKSLHPHCPVKGSAPRGDRPNSQAGIVLCFPFLSYESLRTGKHDWRPPTLPRKQMENVCMTSSFLNPLYFGVLLNGPLRAVQTFLHQLPGFPIPRHRSACGVWGETRREMNMTIRI